MTVVKPESFNSQYRSSVPVNLEHATVGPVPIPSYVAWGVLSATVTVAALYLFRKSASPPSSAGLRRRDRLEPLGFGILVVAAVLGLAHALLVPVAPGSGYTPQADLITLAWVVAAVLGLALPTIVEISFGGVTVRLQEISEDLLSEQLKLSRDWATEVNQYVADIVSGVDDLPRRTEQFVRLRLREALEWLGSDGETRRLTVWLYDASQDKLVFYLSNEISDAATINATFGPDEGFVGACYTERMGRNEINPMSQELFKRIDSSARYGALLCEAIIYGDRRVGVLSVDRQKADYFDDAAVAVVRQLTYLVGIAIGLADEAATLPAS